MKTTTANPPQPLNLRTLAASVAHELSRIVSEQSDDAWEAVPAYDERTDSNQHLRRSDGLTLFFAGGPGGWSPKGRITISLNRPRDAKGGWVEVYTDPRVAPGATMDKIANPEITVAESKEPAAIAADIVRRLLPDAVRVHALAVAKVNESNTSAAEKLATLATLARIAGLPETPHEHKSTEPRFSFYLTDRPGEDDRKILADVEVRHGQTVRIEIDANRAQAAALIAFLRSPAYVTAANA